MEELIKYQQEIKEWSLEKLLNKMCTEYYWGHGNVREEFKKEYEAKVLFIKMEIISRFNERGDKQ